MNGRARCRQSRDPERLCEGMFVSRFSAQVFGDGMEFVQTVPLPGSLGLLAMSATLSGWTATTPAANTFRIVPTAVGRHHSTLVL